ncbi:T9SS type A sorting domain-containing protein [Calditrichota bacterium]
MKKNFWFVIMMFLSVVLLVSESYSEIIGDTVVVGNTYWEPQMPGTVGRMIGYYPDEFLLGRDVTVESAVSFVWTGQLDQDELSHIYFERAGYDSDGDLHVEYALWGGVIADLGRQAKWTTMGFNSENGMAYPVYLYEYYEHQNEWRIATSVELYDLFPGVFQGTNIPDMNGNLQSYPHAVFDNNTEYIHILTSENLLDDNPTAPQEICYSKHQYDGRDNHYNFNTNDQILVTEYGCNVSGDIAVSDDGSRVAIGQTVSREYFIDGNGEEDWNPYNQDLYIWISEDGGDTWDWDEPINLTEFIGPDTELLPDTLEACKDTLRAYTDCCVYFDHDDLLHVAFTACVYYDIPDENKPVYSMIYHWDEESDVFTLISNGYHGLVAGECGELQRTRQRPCLYQDPLNEILWCVFQGYGYVPSPDTTQDVSDEGFANAEIYISASPPAEGFYGKLWAKEVNITNTEWTGDNPAEAGECRSECYPSLALNNDGDYLNIAYFLDYHAGTSGYEEGEFTENSVIWHRVSKDELIRDCFQEQDEWVINYPLHVDWSHHWHDWMGYDWELHGDRFYVSASSPPVVSFSTDSLDCGNVGIESSDTSYIVFENSGFYGLHIDSVKSSSSEFTFSDYDSIRITRGEIDSFEVIFRPLDTITYDATITVYCNDPFHRRTTIPVTGQGIILPAPNNLTCELDTSNGIVFLDWEFNGYHLDEFIGYTIYRNDIAIAQCDTTHYEDSLIEQESGIYTYSVRAIYDEGESFRSNEINIEWNNTAVDEHPCDEIPAQWDITALYPNPFNPVLNIVIAVPENNQVRAEIYDVQGRLVVSLLNSQLIPGYHKMTWTADGSSGIYFLVVSNNIGWRRMQKIVYLK